MQTIAGQEHVVAFCARDLWLYRRSTALLHTNVCSSRTRRSGAPLLAGHHGNGFLLEVDELTIGQKVAPALTAAPAMTTSRQSRNRSSTVRPGPK